MRKVTVDCGDVPNARGKRAANITLDVGAPRGDPRRINLKVEQLTRAMTAQLPDRLADLLEIACYVYCADQFSARDTPQMARLGEAWRRAFAFRIAVRDPGFWNSTGVQTALATTLGFLSEDRYVFTFSETERSPRRQDFLDLHGAGPVAGFRPDRVMLFSGGLDSFAGAAEALLRDGAGVALVSHHSSHLVHSIQKALVQALQGRAGADRLLHVSVAVNSGAREAVEFTQRSRAFLFASLGFVVAHMLGQLAVSFCENGVVSLNLPLARHVTGTRATRTTHPRVLHDLSALFSTVAAKQVRVDNPFFWNTKADIVRKIATAGCASLIPRTFSCARVRQATQHSGRHCGVCSQCVDRRFGVLAAGCGSDEPPECYDVELLRGAREPGLEAVMAESYVLSAYRHAQSSEAAFLSTYGEVFRAVPYLGMRRWEAATRVHELHVQHGKAVTDVVTAHQGGRDAIGDRLSLPDSSLLGMIQASAARDIKLVDQAEREPPVSEQALADAGRMVERRLTFEIDATRGEVRFNREVTVQGVLATLLQDLVPTFQEGQRGGHGSDGGSYTNGKHLAARLGIDDATLRKQVVRLRADLRKRFYAQLGMTIGDDDIVQNAPGRGYRLNPQLVLVPTLVGSSQGLSSGHVTRLRPGVTTLP